MTRFLGAERDARPCGRPLVVKQGEALIEAKPLGDTLRWR